MQVTKNILFLFSRRLEHSLGPTLVIRAHVNHLQGFACEQPTYEYFTGKGDLSSLDDDDDNGDPQNAITIIFSEKFMA